jgi:selenide,water dikinase
MGPTALAQVLRQLGEIFPAEDHPNLLVGLDGADDAAVYRLRPDEVLIATTDFFPPIVDDAYDFGYIAAANAMSDVFAMGGEVLFALNLVAFPETLPESVTAAILRGGAEAVRAAAGVIAGGHSVMDREPKYGLAVIGRAHPDRLLRKSGARPGDLLVLTKSLGTGLVTTALKRGVADPADVAAASASMKTLNRAAGQAAVAAGAKAATDITGYGLAGHALEMANQGQVAFRFTASALPLLPGALAYAAAGCIPGGGERNREAFAPQVQGLDALPAELADLLFDPQTSGGLLVALAPAAATEFMAALAAAGHRGTIIGAVEAGSGLVLEP